MREEEFDKIIKQQVDKQIQAPEELKNRIRTEIRNMNVKPKRNMKVIQGIAAVFTVAILGVTTYAGVTGNLTLEKMGLLKASENYDENAVDINQTISNEYTDITLKSIACDNAYIITEYQINLKEKISEDVEFDQRRGYKLDFNYNIKVNKKDAEIMSTYVNKTGEREYQYFHVINIMDIEDKKLDIEIDLNEMMLNQKTILQLEGENSIPIYKKINIDIERQNMKAKKFEKIEKVIGNKTISIEEVANTNFETFITAKQITKNITYKEYNDNAMSYGSFMLTQENGESIPYAVYDKHSKVWVTRNGQKVEMDMLEGSEVKEDEKIELEESFIINVGRTENEFSKIAITPTVTKLLNDRTDEEENEYNKAKWHKLEDKKYTATSSMGGTLEIEKIEVTDNEIIFYYNKIGNIGNESLILMRNNNGKYNYSCSAIEEEKGINGDENKIVFLRKDTGRAGIYGYDMTEEEFVNLLNDDISNLEFTMLFGGTTQKVGDAIEVEIPKLDKQTIKIENVQIKDLERGNDESIKEKSDNENFTDLSGVLGEVDEEYINSEAKKVQEINTTGKKMKKGETSISGIKLGMTREDAIKEVGNVEIKKISDDENETLSEVYGNDIEVLYVKENDQYRVWSIRTSQENIKTDKGIKYGDSLEKVVSKYTRDNKIELVEDTDTEGNPICVLYGKKEIEEQGLERLGIEKENTECAYIKFVDESCKNVVYVANGEEFTIMLENDKVIDVALSYSSYRGDGI